MKVERVSFKLQQELRISRMTTLSTARPQTLDSAWRSEFENDFVDGHALAGLGTRRANISCGLETCSIFSRFLHRETKQIKKTNQSAKQIKKTRSKSKRKTNQKKPKQIKAQNKSKKNEANQSAWSKNALKNHSILIQMLATAWCKDAFQLTDHDVSGIEAGVYAHQGYEFKAGMCAPETSPRRESSRPHRPQTL